MERNFNLGIDYIAECLSLLTHLAKSETYQDLEKSLHITFNSKPHIFPFLQKVEKAAKQYFANDLEQIQYYFNGGKDISGCVGESLSLYGFFDQRPYHTLEEMKTYLHSISEEEYCQQFGHSLQGYTDMIHNDDEYQDLKDVISIITYLTKMDIPLEEKWKIQTCFLNREEHLAKIEHLYEQCFSFLHQYDEELNQISTEFTQYWSTHFQYETMHDFLLTALRFDVPVNPLGFHFCMSIFHPTSLGVNSDLNKEEIYKKPDDCIVGVLFGDELSLLDGFQSTKEDLSAYTQQVCKLLSDKSKFDILLYISKKKAYGSELAKHLGLTTATISYHMNALMSEKLVTIEREDNKIYYTLNQDGLRKMMDYISKTFELK